MKRIFIDPSVLFSAFYSATGASSEIIRLGINNKIILIISNLVIEEVNRNLKNKAPTAFILFQNLLNIIPFEIVIPTKKEIKEALLCVALKDAPILAASRKSKADYLASLDKKHLVGINEVNKCAQVKIVLPEQLLRIIKK